MKSILIILAALALVTVHPSNKPAQPAPQPLPATRINAVDGAEMVLVPAGEFLMGTSEEQLAAWLKTHPKDKREDYADEMPQRSVYLDAYYIDKTEVTVGQYRKFCTATGQPMPAENSWKWHDNDPIVWVDWDDAAAYAKWAGVALPTEAQWEKAARGTDGRIFPWGNDWDAGKCRNTVGHANPAQVMPVGSYHAGASPYGCLDMAGNVWEWCADWYDPNYYQHAPDRNPTGPAKQLYPDEPIKVIRGGGWNNDQPGSFRVTYRSNEDYDPPTLSDSDGFVGFRCVVNVPAH